jgi:hypothetical protein
VELKRIWTTLVLLREVLSVNKSRLIIGTLSAKKWRETVLTRRKLCQYQSKHHF